jgi:hypothetical protein
MLDGLKFTFNYVCIRNQVKRTRRVTVLAWDLEGATKKASLRTSSDNLAFIKMYYKPRKQKITKNEV